MSISCEDVVAFVRSLSPEGRLGGEEGVIYGPEDRTAERVLCGKPNCNACPHRAYWYACWSHAGKTVTRYAGKAGRPLQDAEVQEADAAKDLPKIRVPKTDAAGLRLIKKLAWR